MKIFLIFIVFLGPLIFFHELGHFLFARLFGVRVETFSLGFGPKLFRFKRKGTEYVLSLIPLGGYVKMFGDDPTNKDKIPEEEKKFSYNHKPVWARFWIVFGGPLANFLLAYFIFFALLLNGERLPEIRFGVIAEKSSFYQAGIRSGDVLKSVNGKAIEGPSDLDFESEKNVEKVEVERAGKVVPALLNLTGKEFLENLLSSPPYLRKPAVVNGKGEVFYVELANTKFERELAIEQFADVVPNNELVFYKTEAGIDNPNKVGNELFRLKLNYQTTTELVSQLQKNGYYTIDLVVKSINMGSPADKAGLKRDDIIVSLDGKLISSFDEVRLELQKTTKETIQIGFIRAGKTQQLKLAPKVEQQDGQAKKLIGVYSGGGYQEVRFVHTHSKGIIDSSWQAFGKTWESFVKTAAGFKKLITGEVSFKNVGGPIAIGKVASDSFNTSLSYFFQIMALISVNLAIINLFPIPVLDGGHILFMILEVINRGPLSRRKMEIAQQVGLSFLLLLMCAAIFNDVSRFF